MVCSVIRFDRSWCVPLPRMIDHGVFSGNGTIGTSIIGACMIGMGIMGAALIATWSNQWGWALQSLRLGSGATCRHHWGWVRPSLRLASGIIGDGCWKQYHFIVHVVFLICAGATSDLFSPPFRAFCSANWNGLGAFIIGDWYMHLPCY